MVQSALTKAAHTMLRKNIKLRNNENVLIVTDRRKDVISEALFNAASALGARPEIAKITPKRLKMKIVNADVVLAPTIKSISHSPETRLACKRGTRVASMPGITEKLFIKASKQPNLKKINQRLLKKIGKAGRVLITSSNGTALVIDTTGFKSDDGDCSKKGSLRNFPSGEIYSIPLRKVNGTLVPDVIRNKINPKIVIKLKNGRLIDWNASASSFVKSLRKAGSCGLRAVELGIGTNPLHKKPTGNILHDEKIYASAHIAFGFGAKCPIHEDVIILKPTLWTEDKLIIKDGKFYE
jgi:leucyl aminopeptidase (aminopeptidase T)